MDFDTVYYSGLWYSRFMSRGLAQPHDRGVRGDIEDQRKALRVMSLFFKTIYIPRTHCLTQIVPDQWEFTNALMSTEEAVFLNRVGSLRLSSAIGLDGFEDNERIRERQKSAAPFTYNMPKAVAQTLAKMPTVVIEAGKESRDNAESFPEYGRELRFKSPSLSVGVLDAMDRATIPGISFFHEHFVHRARENLQDAEFEHVWRATNSKYLTESIPSRTGGIAYFNQSIESADYRYVDGVDRFLYTPEVLLGFMRILLKPAEVKKFLHAPASKVLKCLDHGDGWWLLDDFRGAYQNVVKCVSEVYGSDLGYQLADTADSVRALGVELAGNAEKRANQLEQAIKEGSSLERALSSSHVFGVLASPILLGKEVLTQYAQARRYPGIYDFRASLKTNLRLIK